MLQTFAKTLLHDVVCGKQISFAVRAVKFMRVVNDMAKAKVLSDSQIGLALQEIASGSADSFRDALMLMLSVSAGLRAQEIARLALYDVTDVEGAVTATIRVSKYAAKYCRERPVPMLPQLQEALSLYIRSRNLTKGPLFSTRHGRPMTPNAVEKQLGRIFRRADFRGASSHSGRRTFITRTSRRAHLANCTLKDVQRLAGHASLSSTEAYIEESPNQAELVRVTFSNENKQSRSVATDRHDDRMETKTMWIQFTHCQRESRRKGFDRCRPKARGRAPIQPLAKQPLSMHQQPAWRPADNAAGELTAWAETKVSW